MSFFRKSSSKKAKSKAGSTTSLASLGTSGNKKRGKQLENSAIKTYNAVYLGSVEVDPRTRHDARSCYDAVGSIGQQYDGMYIDAKVSLVISMYGVKAMRTSFSGMTQEAAMEIGDGGVSFDFIANDSIFRIMFCTDIDKRFCYVSEDKMTGKHWVYAFKCKSKKVAREVSETVAEACARVVATLQLIKDKVIDAQAVDGAVIAARAAQERPASAREASKTNRLVDVLNYQGYSDADERFHAELLELAGVEQVEYNQPTPDGPSEPSARTIVRQSDPNEYERTRF